jgi:aryl-alcohol dehydrogenase-like predicted oxidoreductase
LAFAYALDHPHLATVLFGATSAEQVRSNVAAVATYQSLDDAKRAAVAALA